MPCTCLGCLTKLTPVVFCRNKPCILQELLLEPQWLPTPHIPTHPSAQILLSSTPVRAGMQRPPLYLPTTHRAPTYITSHAHCPCTYTCSHTRTHLSTLAPEQTHVYHVHTQIHMLAICTYLPTCTNTHLATTPLGPALMPLGQAYPTFLCLELFRISQSKLLLPPMLFPLQSKPQCQISDSWHVLIKHVSQGRGRSSIGRALA